MEKHLLLFLLLSLKIFLPCHAVAATIDDCVALSEFLSTFSDIIPRRKEGEDCCSWGGVECDDKKQHVISLDLSSSGLDGSINSSSTLFHLLHLKNLNLADNDFFGWTIPPQIGNLTSLVRLNLSNCGLQGQIPSTFFKLQNLSSLDLSYNSRLVITNASLENLILSSNKLEEFHLSDLSCSFSIPSAIGNLSSLRSLIITDTYLEGDLPAAVFELPKLQVLDLSDNIFLSVRLPEFHSPSNLKFLSLASTDFSGELPSSLGRLGSLNVLKLADCNIKGFIPCSISNLTQLGVLDLSFNNLQGPISCFANLTELTSLRLIKNRFSGDISSAIEKLVLLDLVDLSYNAFTGGFPQRELMNLTRLVYLDVAYNGLHGRVQLDLLLHHLTNLRKLNLGFNYLSVVEDSSSSSGLPLAQLRQLQLGSCNLQEIPKVLKDQDGLFGIDLSHNNISGTIPIWFFNVSTRNLMSLGLSNNLLTTFSDTSSVPAAYKWKTLIQLDLRYNNLQGSVPIPPKTIRDFLVSNNRLTGEIPSRICDCSDIGTLDLSKNHLSGAIPQCFGNFSEYLSVLSLNRNNLSGRIPFQLFRSELLNMVDLSNNQLEGPLASTLWDCRELVFLNLGNNMIRDTFPSSWLGGSLASLEVLILRSNKFYGAIPDKGDSESGSPELHIIDLSHNDFHGHLPSKYIQSWTSMATLSAKEPDYMKLTIPYLEYDALLDEPLYQDGITYYNYSMTIMNKGLQMEYPKIIDYFTVIDFSSNNFSGEIPTSIVSLKALHLLNLSNNALTGPIPPSLGVLEHLEALDLSRNKLTAQIPKELINLNFLQFFDVSHNNLSGKIPQGAQFDTFGNRSYQGNVGLCGDPLSRRCNDEPKHKDNVDDDLDMSFYIEWKAVVIGYASAFIIAALIGHWTITVRQNWFVIISRLREQRRIRQR